MEDIEKRTAQFVKLRDEIKRLDDEHKAKVKPLKDVLERLTGVILTFMNENNLQNAKTAAGTVHRTHRSQASLADPDAFMNYVIEKRAFELLDRKANTTAVKEFVKEHKALPPGCNLSTIETLGVRRGAEATTDE